MMPGVMLAEYSVTTMSLQKIMRYWILVCLCIGIFVLYIQFMKEKMDKYVVSLKKRQSLTLSG